MKFTDGPGGNKLSTDVKCWQIFGGTGIFD